MVAKRRDGLVVEVVHTESLVFNPERGEATALNESAAHVFELCDGTNTVSQMKAALESAGLGPSSDAAVWLALGELADAGLIDLEAERPGNIDRRKLLKQVGFGAAALAALPVVETIRAPSIAAASSSTPSTPAPTSSTPAPTTSPVTPAPTATPGTPAPTATPGTPAPTATPATPAPTDATPAPTATPATPAPTGIITPTPVTPAPTPAPTTTPI